VINFDLFSSRFDDGLLHSLLGASAMKLITAIDPQLATRSRLVQLVIDLFTPSGLLLQKKSRNQLFELLTIDEAITLAQLLELRVQNSPFEALKECAFASGSAREKILFDFFGVEIPNRVVYDLEPQTETIDASYSLFDYQRRAVRRINSFLSGDTKRVVLHMPTGSGKTRTAMNVIAEHLRSKEPTLVVWLANSQELCEQAASEFEKAWICLGNRNIPIIRYWESYSMNVDQIGDGLVVAGLAKVYQALTRDLSFITRLGVKASLIVIDEAHASIADTYMLILDSLVAQRRGTALLGLTATPGRSWLDIDADKQLAAFFNRQKVSLEIPGYSNPVDYLTEQGYLAKAEFRRLFYDGGSSISSEDLRRIEKNLDIPHAVLTKLAEDDQRNLMIIAEIESLVQVHSRIIVFAATVEHSQLLAAILRARGIHAQSITSNSSAIERATAINMYKEGTDDTRVICNYGVLTTGFDAPKTSAAVIARPTKSLVLYSQMVGRAIRGVRAGGNPTAEIVTVVDHSLPGFGTVAESFSHWEDIWE